MPRSVAPERGGVDLVLAGLGPDDLPFTFGYRNASKLLAAAVARVGATTMPQSQSVRWKDLRSGMACHLLKNGWTRDEVNARLGHTPSSGSLDAYINFLALDRNGPKQRLVASSLPTATPRADEGLVLKDDLMRTYRELSELRAQVQELKAGGNVGPAGDTVVT